MLEQLHHLDGNYAGGLAGYIQNAKRLLEDSRTGELAANQDPLLMSQLCTPHSRKTICHLWPGAGKNAFEGLVPTVPEGEKLDFGSKAFREFEQLGERQPDADAAFAQRMVYSNVKWQRGHGLHDS